MRPRLRPFLISSAVLVSTVVLLLWAVATPQPSNPVSAARQSPPDAAEQKLEEIISEIHFEGLPLERAVDQIRQSSGANLFVSWRNLRDAGVLRTTPVDLHLRNVTLAQALNKLCDALAPEQPAGAVDFTLHDSVIVLTSVEDLSRYATVRVYDVRDLLEHPPAIPTFSAPPDSGHGLFQEASMAGASPEARTRQETIDEILRLIMETVSPDSWRDAGGALGSIRELSGRLVVVQTWPNHRQIRNLLEQLRDPEPPKAAPRGD